MGFIRNVACTHGKKIRKCILRDYADLAETEKEEIYNWVCHVLIMLQFEDYAQAFVKLVQIKVALICGTKYNKKASENLRDLDLTGSDDWI